MKYNHYLSGLSIYTILKVMPHEGIDFVEFHFARELRGFMAFRLYSAVKATQKVAKVAGEEFVKSGANKISDSVAQGIVEVVGKITGKIIEEKIKKSNQK